jgi:NAD(P)-dependent dehydrogenase (short-subunit alcohol dehydrogenase family)
MDYFVTGASGFIGRRLVERILQRPGSRVFFLILERELPTVDSLRARWGVDETRAVPMVGDLTQAMLGLSATQVSQLRGHVAHFFHLAAIYDLRATARAQQAANVDGTRHAVELAQAIEAGCFHLASSIAAAGLYEGVFHEDMFDEAENLDHPYFSTKHESERIVRKSCKRPFRIYRPAIVVGDSRTGEMDKIDGPYYFFKLIQRIRRLVPQWMPMLGLEGSRLNLVPVDFVVAAMDHLAHEPGLDGRCFHLTDPNPKRIGDILNVFARAAHAPEMTMRVDVRMLNFVPDAVWEGMSLLTPVRRLRRLIMDDLGLPPDITRFVNYPTRFDSRQTQALLAPAGIKVPPLEEYAWRLWDYWERHLDPDLMIDRSLAGTVGGKVVVITGGADGIGKAAALKLAGAGATVAVIDRDQDKLDQTLADAEAAGGKIAAYNCDLTDYPNVDATIARIVADHGHVDILVNNAGRSIRRSIENSYDRFHDFERTMQLNYFGTLRTTLAVLPLMQKQRKGHVIHISSIGVLTNAPRFAAYVASKAAVDAFNRCAASEFLDSGISFTTINMPLVRTRMTAPTEVYKQVPMLGPDDAANLIAEAILHKPARIATRLGVFAVLLHALAPKFSHLVMNTVYRMFTDSAAALGRKESQETAPTPDQLAFAQIVRGIHF